MKQTRGLAFFGGVILAAAGLAQAQDFLDRVDDALTISAFHDDLRARLSGTLDLEGYHFQQPAPGLIDSSHDGLLNPRLSLFIDAQWRSQIYLFVQARVDRGFDPSDHGAEIRLDEYAARYTPWEDGRFTLQAGKFATVVGNFVPRHLSWDNPFINAPLPYENVTPVTDAAAPRSRSRFLTRFVPSEKYEFNPIIWGPSYATGASVSGRIAQFDYAAEIKNASLSSRPESWDAAANGFNNPAFSGRMGFRPNESWNLGISASEGAYFRERAESTLPPGKTIGEYHEWVLGQDAGFAWHHLQLWAEIYEARFEVPRVGDADTVAWYLEAKYKFLPQWFAALRWNQQLFNSVPDGQGGNAQWGADLARIDAALAYRPTAHMQWKLQYSFQKETSGPGDDNHTLSTQVTVRF
jgi:hypothetical protein